MYAVVVTFDVDPARLDAFLPLMMDNAAASLRDEPGCHRFDVAQDPEAPTRIFLYELYTDPAAFEAHKATAHYKVFTERAVPMLVGRDVRFFTLLTKDA